MKIIEKGYRQKPMIMKNSKLDLKQYLTILSVIMLFSTACATEMKFDLYDYEKAERNIENTRTYLKNGENSTNMNIHPGTYRKEDTEVVLNAEHYTNIIHMDMDAIRFAYHDTTITATNYLKNVEMKEDKDPANEVLKNLLDDYKETMEKIEKHFDT